MSCSLLVVTDLGIYSTKVVIPANPTGKYHAKPISFRSVGTKIDIFQPLMKQTSEY
jgi:hypothetical protein